MKVSSSYVAAAAGTGDDCVPDVLPLMLSSPVARPAYKLLPDSWITARVANDMMTAHAITATVCNLVLPTGYCGSTFPTCQSAKASTAWEAMSTTESAALASTEYDSDTAKPQILAPNRKKLTASEAHVATVHFLQNAHIVNARKLGRYGQQGSQLTSVCLILLLCLRVGSRTVAQQKVTTAVLVDLVQCPCFF